MLNKRLKLNRIKMAADVDIKIKIQAERAKLELERIDAGFRKLAVSEQQASLKTQILEKRLEKLSDAGEKAKRGFSVADIALASFVGNLTSRVVSSSVTSLVNSITGLVKAGQDFEDGIISVGKTTGISGKALQDLGDDITELSNKIPVSTNNLLELATVAGQLGLNSSSQIIQFTETLGKLTLATDIAGEQGAQSVASILTVTNELRENGEKNINKFGNVITRLGNNFAATEAQILKVAQRVAQGIAPFGVASENVLAISTALKATGSEAEAAGTAIQKTFQLIGAATQEGGEKLQRFANAANLTTEEFVKLFNTDPTELFVKLTTALGQAGLTGAELNAKLKELGLSDLRLAKSLNPLITNYEVLQDAIRDAQKEATDLTALNEEAAKAADTLSGDVKQLGNQFSELGKAIFEIIGPALRLFTQGLTSILDGVTAIVQGAYFEILAGATAGLAAGFIASNAAAITLAFTGLPALIAKLVILAAQITVASGGLNLIVPALVAVGASVGLIITEFRIAAQEAIQFSKNVNELDKAFKEADKETQNYVSTLNSLSPAVSQTKNNMVEVIDAAGEIDQRMRDAAVGTGLYVNSVGNTEIANARLKEELDAITEAAGSYIDELMKFANRRKVFEKEKLDAVKKYFTEEEIAKIETNAALIMSDQEREEFEKVFLREGLNRQRQATLALIGLDKATVEAKRQRLQELQKIAEEELTIEEEMAFAKRQQQLIETQEFTEFNQGKLLQVRDYYNEEEKIAIEARLSLIENERQKQLELDKIVIEGLNRRSEKQIQTAKEVADQIIEQDNREIESKKRKRKEEERIDQLRLQGYAAVFGGLASIARLGGKKLFAITKAAAVAESTIRTILAVQQALNTPPGPPVTIPLAVGIGLQGAARTAAIASQSSGFANGGIVAGTQFSGDRVAARVNSGEMILNKRQQAQLFNMANGHGQNGNNTQEIVVNTTIQLNEETIAEAVSRQVANGLVLGEVQ